MKTSYLVEFMELRNKDFLWLLWDIPRPLGTGLDLGLYHLYILHPVSSKKSVD